MCLPDRLAHGFELLLIVEVERMNPAYLFLKVEDIVCNCFTSFRVETRRISRNDTQNAFELLPRFVPLANNVFYGVGQDINRK